MSEKPKKPEAEYAERRDRLRFQISGDRKLSFSARCVGQIMAWCWRYPNAIAWPGFLWMMEKAGASRNTVATAIAELEARGHYIVLRQWSGKRRMANKYVPLIWQEGQTEMTLPDMSGPWVLVEVGKGVVARSHGAGPSNTVAAECFRLAREKLPDKVAAVAKRLDEGQDPSTVLDSCMSPSRTAMTSTNCSFSLSIRG
jgi:hypothetical protein